MSSRSRGVVRPAVEGRDTRPPVGSPTVTSPPNTDSPDGHEPITRDTVAHLARLARLQVTESEIELFAGQLQQILAAVETVSSADTDGVPPTSHPLPLTNVLRPDVVRPSLDRDEALAGAPSAEDGRFRVPRMLDEES